MRLHENKILFRQAILATSQQLKIPEIFIEKDYWVTFALKSIFLSEYSNQVIFKGGTALSKCFRLIDRFSEDIDLLLKHQNNESDNQLKQRIRKIGQVLNVKLPEIKIDDLTFKRGMNRKTAHFYPKVFDGQFGQTRDCIVLETTWLGYFEPFDTQKIGSYVLEMMENVGQEELVKEYDMQVFQAQVLRPTRTFCEKIMSLIRFSYSENPIQDLAKKIRHCYDLNQLLKNEKIKIFFESDEFPKLLNSVAQDDIKSFRNNNQWLRHRPEEAFIFSELDSAWAQLQRVYENEFKALVYGKFPSSTDVFSSMLKIKTRLQRIDWKIKF